MVIPAHRTPRTRRRMPVILGKRAVLNGPSRDALQPKSDWPRLIHAFGERMPPAELGTKGSQGTLAEGVNHGVPRSGALNGLSSIRATPVGQ